MFGRKAADSAEPTVIGRGAVVEGTVRASGPLQVDGQIDGTLHVDGQVSIGPNGVVTGELTADEVVVGGRVEGRLTARALLHVTSGGNVRGEVHYGALQIDRGGVIDGTSVQGHATEAAPRAPSVRPSRSPRASQFPAAVS
jgi:cytoskeletal protein CcmA (bactofilin family)